MQAAAPSSFAHCACNLTGPPETGLLDRLARFFEGGDEGAPSDVLVDLNEVVSGAPPPIAAFYRAPGAYAIRAGATGGAWSRLVMRVFAALFRQTCIPEQDRGFEGYAVCQRVYRDARGRVHWDRYARVGEALHRLFVARLDGAPGRMDETFVLWGVPVRLGFEARVEGDSLVLTLRRRYSSVFAWIAAVEYRTTEEAPGHLRTDGDFRVGLAGVHVKTLFKMSPGST